MTLAGIPGFPTLPQGIPALPRSSPSLEVAPFGELRHPPRVPKPEPIPPLAQPSSNPDQPPPDFTDQDLAEAIQPLLAASTTNRPAEFEAMLRTSLRRALAEHSRGPFDSPGFAQRCMWRLDALLSSHSYEEVVQLRTGRFRIDEVFLYDQKHLSLISFASANPSRHASARKVHTLADRIALKVRDDSGAVAIEFPIEGGRHALVRNGKHAILVALFRGEPDPLTKSDLDYALRRIEEHYRTDLDAATPLLQELQPFLEECLLIHSPIAPAEI